MTTAVQHRRGTTAEHATFTGLEGEVTIDTTKDTAVIHDGVLAGGYPLAKENLANVTTSGLSSIDGASTASDDKFFIYDQSATSLKTITRAELNNAMEQDALANVAITGGTINGTTIGATTAAAASVTTLTTSSTVTLSGGTANGVAYLNGSKVLTTGSALTYNGTDFVNTAGAIRAGTNSGSGGSLSAWGGATGATIDITPSAASGANGVTYNTSFISGGSGPHIWSIGGSEQMRLTSTGLGIGTSSPSAKLHIQGDTNVNSAVLFKNTNVAATASISLLLGNNANNSGGLEYTSSTYTGAANAMLYKGDSHWFKTTGGVVRAIIDSSGNLGIGTSSPAQKLDVVGTIQSQYNAALNDATVGAYNFYNSNASAAANPIRASIVAGRENSAWGAYLDFYTSTGTSAQTSKMRLDTVGNLGLGVTPSAWSAFTAFQASRGSLVANSSEVDFNHNAYFDGTNWRYIGNGFATNHYQFNGGYAWRTAPSGTAGNAITFTQAMTLDASGNLGVGTTSPTARIHSNGTIQSVTGSTGIQIYGDGGTGYVNSIGAYPLVFQVNSTERARIDSSGNLGLGVTPSAWAGGYLGFQIRDAAFASYTSGFTWVGSNWYSSGTNKYIANGYAALYEQTAGKHVFYTAANNVSGAGAAMSLIQAMTLTASGNLLVGTTNDQNYRIKAVADSSGNTGFQFDKSNSTTGNAVEIDVGANNTTQMALQIYSTSNAGNNAVIYSNGNIVNRNNSYGSLSDVKLKENIVDATPKLEKLNQVRVVNYNIKGEEQKQLGVIAQELEQIFPGMVEESPDRDKEGNDLGTTTKSVKYSVFVPMLIKAIQELKAEFDAYKATHP